MKNILLYAPDGVGYGHIARMANFSKFISKYIKHANILFVSGYDKINYFLDSDTSIDYIKLPYLNKLSLLGNSHKKAITNEHNLLRKSILQSIFTTRRFNYIFIDFFPFGKKNELIDILDYIKYNTKSKIILCQRGIIFSKDETTKFFNRDFGIDFINRVYDKIICFCDPIIIDINKEYFDQKIKRKIEYVGYIFTKFNKHKRYNKNKQILVNCGGGYKCDNIIISVLNELEKLTNYIKINVVVGEYLISSTRQFIYKKYKNNINFTINDFIPKSLIGFQYQDIVIGCGGYNTLAETIFNNKPIIVIPKNKTKEAIIHSNILKKYCKNLYILPLNNICQLNKFIHMAFNNKYKSPSLMKFNKKSLYKIFIRSEII